METRKATAIMLMVMSVGLRCAAIVLCGLCVVLCVGGASAQLGIVQLVIDITAALPSIVAGYGVIPSPFGGVFHFDFFLSAAVLFALDLLCVHIARRLRT